MLIHLRAKLCLPAICIAIAVFAFACKKDSSTPQEPYDASKEIVVKNVAYGNDTSEIMDAYLPAGRTTASTKVLVMIHGGSWNEGDKADFNDAINGLKALLPGYAIFNINYRLAANGHNIYPAAPNDVALALQFISKKSSVYVVDTGKIVLGGASAGAHLALLQAYTSNSPNIKAVIDLFGPTNLTWLYQNHPVPVFAQAVLENFLGASLSQKPSLYQQASPVNFVSSMSPPTIIFHGDADPVVPIEQSNELENKLKSFNITEQYIVYPGEGHGWASAATYADTYQKITEFLNLYVK